MNNEKDEETINMENSLQNDKSTCIVEKNKNKEKK